MMRITCRGGLAQPSAWMLSRPASAGVVSKSSMRSSGPPRDAGLLQAVVTLEERLRLQRLYTACNHLLYGGAEEAEAAG